jgi:hypothetical protein
MERGERDDRAGDASEPGSVSGARAVPWWRSPRPPAATPWWVDRTVQPNTAAAAPEEPSATPARVPGVVGPSRSPTASFVLAGIALVVLVASSLLADIPVLSRVLVPVVGLFGTIGCARVLQARHPNEPWIERLLILGVIVKLIASVLRYLTLVNAAGQVGDASVYDTFGRRYAYAWLGKAGSVLPHLVDLKKSNFLRWFTGIVYYLFGRDLIAGFFVFGLLALAGSYMWYRAAVLAVPYLDRKLFFLLIFFAPSIVFWPSSIGKESLMQFGLGGIALGTAQIMNGRLVQGVAVATPGAWLVFIVRAHLLGLAVLAAAFGYVLGRKSPAAQTKSSLARPAALVFVSLFALFAVTQGAQALGIKSLSLSSVQNELDTTNASTSQGHSSFSNSNPSLSPLRLPQDAVTVLLRPFPWEVETKNQILASLEGMALVAFMVHRRRSVALSLRRLREQPFVFYCWNLTLLYVLLFQAFGNFGLLVRERSIVLPALYVILSLNPEAEPPSALEPATRGAVRVA